MSGKHFDWAGWIGWPMDQFVFTNLSARFKSPLEANKEASDYSALREQAREADAKTKGTNPRLP